MSVCVIFGGSGFIGTHIAKYFLQTKRFSHIHIADIKESNLKGIEGVSYSFTDVRKEIDLDLIKEKPEWIFNLAAIHREPGHKDLEYLDTNINGAYNVCKYALNTNCRNIYFTSSISVYGSTEKAIDESSKINPITPYGVSKYSAELIHKTWFDNNKDRKLVISRPGVVYGPGDPGNIMRMIKAIKKGYFAYPGSSSIHKSYSYIYGLLESIDFLMSNDINYTCYNYVEYPTENLSELVNDIKDFLKINPLVLSLPLSLLLPIAKTLNFVLGDKNPVHPVRVKKAGTSTHIIPKTLKDLGFKFNYDFRKSLEHWQKISPEDFQ